ncbi:hypothetical protein W911_09930 [Hyphomicrobium nitrativorans NL23]|uniref:Diguanylate cyclase n=2 Tax=Hyphomicrobium TaxID=81 RepID=V5SF10_9HYPH|nr:hypothetical protein W911_09930 [Hyphomicrobium nitrativorans NL23]
MGDLQLAQDNILDGGDAVDWSGAGLPSFGNWPAPLQISAAIVANAPGPMLLLIGPQAILYANSAGVALIGSCADGPVLGRPIVDVLPRYAELFAVALVRAARGEGTSFRNHELRCVRDGVPGAAWFNLEFTPVLDANGLTLGVLCMASEVTHHVERARELAVARKQLELAVILADAGETETALAESRFQFDTLTESLPQIVWSSDAEGRHDYFSRRWTEFTGIEPHEITEDTWKELVHPEDWERVWHAWEGARRTGEPYDIDYRFLHHSGDYRWLRVMALPVRDGRGAIMRWCGTSTDVHDAYLLSEERQRLAYELERIANWDQLTGVLTRRAFFERSEKIIVQLAREFGRVSVLMLDVDHFKQINDGYGHPAGDAVLSLTAKRMDGLLKGGDLLGRLGGEEFAVLLPGTAPDVAMAVADRIRSAIEVEPFAIDGGVRISVTLSIGVASGVACEGDLERLLSIADKALYQAKSGGRNRSALVEA